MAQPRRRRHELFAIIGGRAVSVTHLLTMEVQRVERDVLPVYRARGPRGELDAWFAQNATVRARKALEQRRTALVARCYAELRKYEREEAQA